MIGSLRLDGILGLIRYIGGGMYGGLSGGSTPYVTEGDGVLMGVYVGDLGIVVDGVLMGVYGYLKFKDLIGEVVDEIEVKDDSGLEDNKEVKDE